MCHAILDKHTQTHASTEKCHHLFFSWLFLSWPFSPGAHCCWLSESVSCAAFPPLSCRCSRILKSIFFCLVEHPAGAVIRHFNPLCNYFLIQLAVCFKCPPSSPTHATIPPHPATNRVLVYLQHFFLTALKSAILLIKYTLKT